ncbi:class III lanthionine synthetase LanKC [Streptomyces sp. NPDC005955]|uniref:class III lanthionine synthetase LanKC n=1 Tax=Streptomyces sp. NPDC005955 TaxID=3364738 RepID=UPI0036747F13
MNPEYAAYTQADADFYDSPRHGAGKSTEGPELFAAARAAAPEGWRTEWRGDWLSFSPQGLRLPAQGWKIHISAAADNAERVLDRVVAHCVERRLPLKFVPGPRLLLLRNAKYADRAGSGKFITVYPHSEEQFPAVADALVDLLAGEHGPYVLSDLRLGDGPVYVRYGAFARRFCLDAEGRTVPAVADPDGTLVPDLRGPSFRVPAWVTPPPFLAQHLAARTGADALPYTVEGALHFSNGGGVYRARDPHTGRRVVLKEGRPHAGLAADGADAVQRLDRERAALEQLAGLDCVPELLGSFTVEGHRFLALEYVAGTTLNTVLARRFPLSRATATAAELAEHAAWARDMHARVADAVRAVHERGLVISDLHLSNIMVSEDGTRVVLLDFEAASPAVERRRQIVANPSFVAPPGRRGTDIDTYALACLRLALLTPLTVLFSIDRAKARHLVREITRIFPVTADELAPALTEILRDPDPDPDPDLAPDAGARPVRPVRSGGPAAARPDAPDVPEPADWPRSRDSMVRALTAACTPDREDRCFPGDIAQFLTPVGGQSFGYGAAGVLHALHETGAAPCPQATEWLLDRAKEPVSGTPIGFYDGLAGIAWTLHRLGHRAQGLALARLIAREPLDGRSADLHGGHAGLALALDDLSRATDGAEAAALRTAAERCTELAAHTVRNASPTRRTGLLHGASGPALLFVRRYETTGDAAYLDLAATALRQDLDRCRTGTDGALLVLDGKRTLPYLGGGSAGIAMVLDDFLAHRDDPELRAAREQIEPGLRSAFYIQPGLFRGAAGLLLQLARTSCGDPAERQRTRERHARLLGLHSVPYAGGLAFPGEQMMRRSMDLATGTAGCLLALGAAFGDRPASLPFLPPLPRPTDRPQPGAVPQ